MIINYKSQFKRDLKRERKGAYGLTLINDLNVVMAAFRNDEKLDEKYNDHPLAGNWLGCRDCHIYPDLVLIYRTTNNM